MNNAAIAERVMQLAAFEPFNAFARRTGAPRLLQLIVFLSRFVVLSPSLVSSHDRPHYAQPLSCGVCV